MIFGRELLFCLCVLFNRVRGLVANSFLHAVLLRMHFLLFKSRTLGGGNEHRPIQPTPRCRRSKKSHSMIIRLLSVFSSPRKRKTPILGVPFPTHLRIMIS